MLASLSLLGAAMALMVGLQVHGSLMERAALESTSRTPVRAVLLQDAPVVPDADDQQTGPVVQVPVRWIDTDGTVRFDDATITGLPRAGDTVQVWADKSHHLVPAPTNPDDATAAGIVAAGITLFLSVAALMVAWCGVRHFTFTRNYARWAREWAEVEPLWSGRRLGGSLS
ncbi:MAG TPA: hypothetical protein VH008_28395 [Pseudonocardia sp.]|nr:hypothetical protein [Pseudonocardia sp.]